MKKDPVGDALVQALRQALTEADDRRLYRSGKLAGLFPSRAGANAEAALQAVRDGLLEVVRTETKGKATVEWARITPRGVEYLHARESPGRALQELHEALQAARTGVPVWLDEMQRELSSLSARLTEQAQRWTRRLEVLSREVEESLRRFEAGDAAAVNGPPPVPWAQEALTYLEHRQATGRPGDCPLPELYAALREHRPDLSMTAFHDGLKQMCDRKALRLLPFTAPPSELTEPEYALLDGSRVLYYAAR